MQAPGGQVVTQERKGPHARGDAGSAEGSRSPKPRLEKHEPKMSHDGPGESGEQDESPYRLKVCLADRRVSREWTKG